VKTNPDRTQTRDLERTEEYVPHVRPDGAVEPPPPPPHVAPHRPPPAATRKGWLWIGGAASLALPWLVLRFTTDYHHLHPVPMAFFSGLGILGAAFLLSWAAEAFQMDVSQALALALLSLIAVMPEYAVDIVFAWRAATDPTQAPYAVANMTGANRLLIGLGWSAVVLLAWWRTRRRLAGRPIGRADEPGQVVGDAVILHKSQSLELTALGAATLYSFFIPLKGGIGLLDTVVLVSLFAVYAWGTARAPAEEPELVGPAAAIGSLPALLRRLTTYALFIYSGLVIFVSAEPFAEGLVKTGAALGIDEFLLVQWLAPLASESPEFLVALLFAWNGLAGAGLRTLVASKVNQWTLLIGTLGLAYSVAKGSVADLPLDARQTEELFLTSAQSLFALVLIANFDLNVREALVLLVTFLFQLLVPLFVPIFVPGEPALHHAIDMQVRLGVGVLYLLASVWLLATSRTRRATLLRLPSMVRETVGIGAPAGTPARQPA
jgi:cation:H+ antiporter